MPQQVEALVLGAGPGGYVCAIRLGQLGKKVILVDRERLGGVCLNRGCIPSKALISVANLVKAVKKAGDRGVEGEVKLDLAKAQAWKSRIVDRLNRGIQHLCKAHGVEVLYGAGRLVSQSKVEVKTREGAQTIQADSIVVATGSRPIELKGFEFDGRLILSSTEALELTQIPERLMVIGGGVTGLELGSLYANLGSQLTVVEMMEQLLPGFDRELAQVVMRSLVGKGAKVHLKAKASGFEALNGRARVTIQGEEGGEQVEADRILVTVGRKPNTEGLGLEKVGVETDHRGFIKTDERMRTNVQGVYAIGDVVGPPFLAHKASREGVVAAEVIAGMPSALNYKALPSAIFTDPEVASVGLTEEEARAKGLTPVVGRFPFTASGRALIGGDASGFVKVVAESGLKRVLGVHMVGSGVADLIGEAALALEMGASAEDIALTIHPHPTLTESLMEASESIIGSAIHILKP